MADLVQRLITYWKLNPMQRHNLHSEAATEIVRLREWIRAEGLNNDTCTRNVLGEVCENCRCKHAPKTREKQ